MSSGQRRAPEDMSGEVGLSRTRSGLQPTWRVPSQISVAPAAARIMLHQPSSAVGLLEVAPATENYQRQGCPLRAEAHIAYLLEAELKRPGHSGPAQDTSEGPLQVLSVPRGWLRYSVSAKPPLLQAVLLLLLPL